MVGLNGVITLGTLIAALEHDKRLNEEASELQRALSNSNLPERKDSLRREIAQKYREIGELRATPLEDLA